MDNTSFSMIDEEGKEVTYDVLFTFESDETKKNYIVYTDNSKDKEGNIEVYASIYYPNSDNKKLDPITTDKEWKVIETILDTLEKRKNVVPTFYLKRIKTDKYYYTFCSPEASRYIVKYLNNLAKIEGIKTNKLWIDKIPETIYVQDIRSKYKIEKKNKKSLYSLRVFPLFLFC